MTQVASDQNEHYVVVSTDSHVGPSVEGQLRNYCEAKHLDDFDRFVTEMKAHGLLSWRSSEATRPGEEESWSFGRSRAELGKDQAAQFGKAAGIRNADQVDH